jgi:hypothetical protein
MVGLACERPAPPRPAPPAAETPPTEPPPAAPPAPPESPTVPAKGDQAPEKAAPTRPAEKEGRPARTTAEAPPAEAPAKAAPAPESTKEGPSAEKPPGKPTPQAKPIPGQPDQSGAPAPKEKGGDQATATDKTPPAAPEPGKSPNAKAPQAKPVPARPAESAAVETSTTTSTVVKAPAHDAGATERKPAPTPKQPPAPQAKVAATALNIEAEQLARRDAGPGPDYAAVARKPRGGGGNAPPEPEAPTKSIPGGPLNIPGSKVDFESRRVERFLDEGGAVLAGRVLDADTGKGVDDAGIEAWMGTRSIHADTDAAGTFRFEGMVPGSRVTLWITATQKYVQERIEVVIPGEKPRLDATFKLLPRAASAGRSGGIGVFLSRRAGRTVISGLDAFGPAERAGLSIGDAIVGIGKRNVSELGPGAIEYLLHGTIGEDIEIAVASNGSASRKLTLKRAGR